MSIIFFSSGNFGVLENLRSIFRKDNVILYLCILCIYIVQKEKRKKTRNIETLFVQIQNARKYILGYVEFRIPLRINI